jgi:hypothetical protein
MYCECQYYFVYHVLLTIIVHFVRGTRNGVLPETQGGRKLSVISFAFMSNKKKTVKNKFPRNLRHERNNLMRTLMSQASKMQKNMTDTDSALTEITNVARGRHIIIHSKSYDMSIWLQYLSSISIIDNTITLTGPCDNIRLHCFY